MPYYITLPLSCWLPLLILCHADDIAITPLLFIRFRHASDIFAADAVDAAR